MLKNNINTVIFDLGGVIIDLSVENTIRAFCDLSGLCADDVKKHYVTHQAFIQLEKGQIQETDFRKSLRTLFNSIDIDDVQLDHAWNAMLVDLPKQKLDLMRQLQERYNVYVLSNTNTIHINYVYNQMMPKVCEERSFEAFAHKVYFSHKVGMRKPEPEIFTFVLDENNLKAEDTVFLDDNIDNINAALSVGMNAIQITHPGMVGGIFD